VIKRAKIYFLVSALLIVIGHSVFPHSHIKASCCSHCISLQRSLTLSDIIKNTLSQDIGLNHLEEFNIRQKPLLLGHGFEEMLNSPDFEFFIFEDFFGKSIFPNFKCFNEQSFLAHKGSRAPPYYV